MANSANKQTSITIAPSEWRRQFHRGWVDAQNGARWAADYDRMSRNEQIAYEQGRLLVREAMVEGFGICVWRGDKAGAKPVDRLWAAVCLKIGRRIVPETWDPKAAA